MFGDQLASKELTTSAQRQANADLTRAISPASETECGQVGARQEQHQEHRGHQQG